MPSYLVVNDISLNAVLHYATTTSISRRTLLATGALLPIAAPAVAQQARQISATGFSFAAVGDTRPMMYLP
jgi:hypothetical protein